MVDFDARGQLHLPGTRYITPPPPLQGQRGNFTSSRNKSLFASFSSEKEDSSFFEKKEAKKLLFLALVVAGSFFRLSWLRLKVGSFGGS
jgi:hypothetical protein